MDKPLYLFTTELVNRAFEAVKSGNFRSIVEFHHSLEETKRCLNNYSSMQNAAASASSKSSTPCSGTLLTNSQQNLLSPDSILSQQQQSSLKPVVCSGKYGPGPPNVKIENPLTPTGGFKRDYNGAMIGLSPSSSTFPDGSPIGGGFLGSSGGPLTPYGSDASNVPIMDTHFHSYSSNGDPLEKMARLTREALPCESTPLKQPKLEPGTSNESGNKSSSSNASKCADLSSGPLSCPNPCLGDTKAASSAMCNMSEDQLTSLQRQHREDRLQRIEGIKSFVIKEHQQKTMAMQGYMPGMPCVPPPNISLDMNMMHAANMNMATASKAMTPPQYQQQQQQQLSMPPHLMGAMMQHQGQALGPPPPPSMGGNLPPPGQDHLTAIVAPPPPRPVGEKRSKTPRSATPKNAHKLLGTGQQGQLTAAGLRQMAGGPPTMMVQGKPAVVVHPNLNAKSNRSASRSQSSTAAPDKFFPGNGGPPNVTFNESQQQQHQMQYGGDQQAPYFSPQWNTPGTHFTGGSGGSGQIQAPNATSDMPPGATATAATVVFNQGPGIMGGPRGTAPNLNLNMNIQINAQAPPPPPSAGADVMMMGGGGNAGGPTGQPGTLRYPQNNDFMNGPPRSCDDDPFFDPGAPYANCRGGPMMSGPPPNVNIAVTGVYPHQHPPSNLPTGTGNCYGSPIIQGGPYFTCDDSGAPMMMPGGNSNDLYSQPCQLGPPMMDGCRPVGPGYQSQQRKIVPHGNSSSNSGNTFTMSIQHSVNMQGGQYGAQGPNVIPSSSSSWPNFAGLQQQQQRPDYTNLSTPMRPPQQSFLLQDQPCSMGPMMSHGSSANFSGGGLMMCPPDYQRSSVVNSGGGGQSKMMPPPSMMINGSGPMSDPQQAAVSGVMMVNQQQRNVQYDVQYKNFQQQLYSNNSGPSST